jgi:hypothetical protein
MNANELELRLVDLGRALEVPATPDLMAAVPERLAPRPHDQRRVSRLRPRRPLAIAITIGVLLAGTAAALPPVRHAIERVFGLRGAVVERVHHLPPVPKRAGEKLHLGRPIPVADAAHAASFRALLPGHGVKAAYVSANPPGGRVTLVVGHSLLTEFRGQPSPYIYKLIGPGARVRKVRVNAGPGLYLYRAPHELLFMNARGRLETDAVLLKGSVLLWKQGRLILRIENAGSLADALALARSLR